MCSFCIREISNKPAMIYLVVGDSEGKQYKISTGRKYCTANGINESKNR